MHRFTAQIPLSLACPEPMEAAIRHVLEGEYETGYDGTGLDILDVGANVGSFALWSSLRWPGSRVRSYEPHPGTFELLRKNTAGHADITIVNAALFPGGQSRATFQSRFAGDGESGLAAYAGDTFVEGTLVESYEVDVVDPATCPRPTWSSSTSRAARARFSPISTCRRPPSSCSNSRTARTAR